MQNIFAQNERNDTSLHMKLEVLNKSLVFPVLQHPASFCGYLQEQWNGYLSKHPNLSTEFCFNSDSEHYYVSFWIEIDKSGKVNSFKKMKSFTKIEAVCYDALSACIKSSSWHPFYKKTKKGKRYLYTKGTLSFLLEKSMITSLHISELDTGNPFFKCN